jgi:ubiquinone/menaquinone biosynthesis C-methylase UbiE
LGIEERRAMNTKNEPVYILGHSPAEIQRLKVQAEILRPITERLLLSTGIGPVMRVLDIGCGAGDVAMLAAGLVGPSGSVVGIDRNPQVLAIARERAQAAGIRHIAFEETSVEDFVDGALFDLVIGRYILMYQSDPAALLRAAARHLKPCGSMAFHELRLRQKCHSVPNVPLFELIDKLIRMAFSSALPNYDAGDRLLQHFWDAGLPQPRLFCETPIWGGADAPWGWLVDTLRSLSPQLHRMGVALKDTFEIEGLENQLRDAIVATRSQVSGPAQICAWARL